MLTITGDRFQSCDGIARRNFLKIGAMGLGGLALPDLLRLEAKDGKKTVRTFGPIVNHKVDLPPAIRDPIMAGFVGAVADPKGTAHPAFLGFPLNLLQVADDVWLMLNVMAADDCVKLFRDSVQALRPQ